MATLITKNSSTASAVPAAGDLVKGELAVNVTDKKVYTKDNSAAVVKLVGSLGNQEANAVAVTGGTINGTTIGATTPSTGAFTTASASSGFTGNLTGNVTGNVSGTAANVTGVVAIANGGTGLSALGTGVQSALGQAVTGSGSFVLSTSPSLTTPNLGTPSAAVLTNATGLPLTTGVTGTLGVANGGTGITAFGTGVATALGQNVTGSGGIVLATSPSLTTPNLGTPSAATLTNATGLPISTGVSGLGTGVATALAVATGSAGAFIVNGGALGTPSSGTVTNLTGTASININGTVGATTPTTGAFTTLSASGNITVSGGTANGVAYLNGSKVLTTGSALTFDGSTFNVSGTVASYALQALPLSGPATLNLIDPNNRTLQILSPDPSGNQARIQTTTNHEIVFGINSAEQMRLTSTGLGIGTSSPAYKLDVVGGSASVSNSGNNPQYRVVDGSVITKLQSLSVGYTGGWVGTESNNNFQIVTNNSAKATFDTSGNLGIGTSSPKLNGNAGTFLTVSNTTSDQTGWLEVQGAPSSSGVASGILTFNNSNRAGADKRIAQISGIRESSADSGAISFFTWNAGSAAERMRLDSSGNLGIGSTNPAAYGKLAVIGAGVTGHFDSTSGAGGISLYESGSGRGGIRTLNGSNGLAFLYGATEGMRLDSSGNLGIGVTPSAFTANTKALQIKNAALWNDDYAAKTSIGYNAYQDTDTTYRYIASSIPAGRYDIVQNSHRWYTAASGTAGNLISFTQAMTLDASGRLGIKATSPGYNLQVNAANPANGVIAQFYNDATSSLNGAFAIITQYGVDDWFIGQPAGTSALTFGNGKTSSAAGTERARITSGGDLLVGTTAQIGNERFGVDSGSGACGKFKGGTSANVTIDAWNPATTGDNIFVAFRTETAETTRGTITYNRTAGLTAYNTTSDYRAKDIIGPTQNTGATIDSLKVYEGVMKGATQARPMMVAHEAQAVTPYAVTGEKDAVNEDGTPKYQQMDHASLVPLLIAEIQSLRARVAQLEAK